MHSAQAATQALHGRRRHEGGGLAPLEPPAIATHSRSLPGCPEALAQRFNLTSDGEKEEAAPATHSSSSRPGRALPAGRSSRTRPQQAR